MPELPEVETIKLGLQKYLIADSLFFDVVSGKINF